MYKAVTLAGGIREPLLTCSSLDCFGRDFPIFIAELHKIDLHISSNFGRTTSFFVLQNSPGNWGMITCDIRSLQNWAYANVIRRCLQKQSLKRIGSY